MLWKNFSLKRRNIKSTLKELLFPVYTFLLVSTLKMVVDIGGQGERQRWEPMRIPSLARTPAAWQCRHAGGECLVVVSPASSAWTQSLGGTLRHMFGSTPSSVRLKMVENQTEAKRVHLDNPGHVLAALHFREPDLDRTQESSHDAAHHDSPCLFSSTAAGAGEQCRLDIDLKLNATSLLEV